MAQGRHVGIARLDLHRHCLAEQRTGPVDWSASKTLLERELAEPGAACFLEVSVPIRAGTDDVRMFEELRRRAQMFEAVTGGEVRADKVEGQDDVDMVGGTETASGSRRCSRGGGRNSGTGYV